MSYSFHSLLFIVLHVTLFCTAWISPANFTNLFALICSSLPTGHDSSLELPAAIMTEALLKPVAVHALSQQLHSYISLCGAAVSTDQFAKILQGKLGVPSSLFLPFIWYKNHNNKNQKISQFPALLTQHWKVDVFLKSWVKFIQSEKTYAEYISLCTYK